MPIKTYETHKKSLHIAWPNKPAKEKDLQFEGGKLAIDSEAAQKFIESLPTFKDGTIEVHDAWAEAKAVAAALRKLANEAAKVADEAEKVAAGLAPKKEAAAKA